MLVLNYIKIGAVVLALAGTFYGGVKWESNSRDSKLLVDVKTTQDKYVQASKRANGLAKKLEETKRELNTIKSAADRNFAQAMGNDNRECVTDDGLRIINEVLTDKPGSIGAERNAEVSSPDSAGR